MSVLFAVLLSAAPIAPQTLNLDPSKSTASYTGIHPAHKWTGTSHELNGLAKIGADGTVQVQVRGPVKSFDSANGNRDEHMQEVLEAIKYPNVTVKCLVRLQGAVSQRSKADCLINLHGKDQKASGDIDLVFDSGKVRAVGTMAVSWDAFDIKRPTLLLVPMSDHGDIAFDVTFGP